MTEIYKNIYVGSLEEAFNNKIISKVGSILNVAKDLNIPERVDHNYLHLGINDDDPSENIIDIVEHCIDFITVNIKKGVLIHCLEGKSRSICIALIYLNIWENKNIDYMIEEISQLRKVDIYPLYLKQIKEYSKTDKYRKLKNQATEMNSIIKRLNRVKRMSKEERENNVFNDCKIWLYNYMKTNDLTFNQIFTIMGINDDEKNNSKHILLYGIYNNEFNDPGTDKYIFLNKLIQLKQDVENSTVLLNIIKDNLKERIETISILYEKELKEYDITTIELVSENPYEVLFYTNENKRDELNKLIDIVKKIFIIDNIIPIIDKNNINFWVYC